MKNDHDHHELEDSSVNATGETVEDRTDTSRDEIQEKIENPPLDFLTKLKISDLEKKVADYESKIESIRSYVKNLEEEMKQARQRAERDFQKQVESKMSSFFLGMLTIVDHFDLCLKSAAKDSGSLVEGIRMIHQQFSDYLKKTGLERLESIGLEFDPLKHEAIAMIPCDIAQEGKIIEEVKAGYSFQGALLRPAQVVVGKSNSAGTEG